MTTTNPNTIAQSSPEGILLVNKPKGLTSFSLVAILRKVLGVKKIGHAGTLDPFATGVMVMLIGRNYTKLSDQFLTCDKEYLAEVHLGITTDTFDNEGEVQSTSDIVPTLDSIKNALNHFQGDIEQIPPMFSAKKIGGKKLYELARKGKEVERAPVKINVETQFIDYKYPHLHIRVKCSKGTYIRSIAYDLGKLLGCGAHLSNLQRTRSGVFNIENCLDGALLKNPEMNVASKIIKEW
ncbi:MAG: tRNA pseudouridine(55) synthase TruB [Parachlamydiaceae bacterium]|nr:tRNA pseudouridine(55) synthase TruB [Parachlamydiaceae bacterium]